MIDQPIRFLTARLAGYRARRRVRKARRQAARPSLDFSQLDDRVMMSATPLAAALPGGVESADAALAQLAVDESVNPDPDIGADAGEFQWDDRGLSSSTPADDPVRTRWEVVFVDTGAADYQQLVDDLLAGDDDRELEVYLLDSTRDGIEQISEILSGYEEVDAMHLVSHGSKGQVKLGDSWLSAENLDGYAGEIAGWNQSLKDGADLLIYGCELASSEDGRTLADTLGALCDCDVAASDDDTGHAALGGDWDLEYTTGVIETSVAFSRMAQASWFHLLALDTVRDEFNAISYNNNDGSQSWSTPWTEIGEADGPTLNKVQVKDDFGDRGLLLKHSDIGIWREVDLSNAVYATLSFDYARESLDDAGEFIDLEVSANGGGSWTPIQRFEGPADDPTPISGTWDISAFIASDTRIRFVTGPDNPSSARLFIDNVQIEYDDVQAPGGVENNLNLWLRADAGVSTAGPNVNQWDNQVTTSPLTNVSASGGARPKLIASTLNFNPVISFDGTNDHLSATSVLASDLFSSNGTSIYTVTSLNNTGDVILQWEDSVLGTNNRVNVEDQLRFDFGDLINDQYTTASPPAGYHILNAVAAPNSPVQLSFNIDGQQTTPGNASGDNPLTLGNTGDFFLGEYAGGGFNEDIDLGEVVIFGSDLTAAEQIRVDSYLAVKYGITLNQSVATHYVDSQGNIIWDATANAAYNDNIAGIGRDLTSALDQTQSKSISADAIVTMSAASDQQNREFLIWGNDNGATSETDAGNPPAVTKRLERIWRVDETGEVGTTTIEFDLTGLTYTGTTASDFHLMIDTNTDFTSGSTLIAASSYDAGTDIVTFTGVNLADGEYFALGTAPNTAPTLVNTAVNLDQVGEDAGPPIGPVGTLISSLVDFSGGGGQDNVIDPDTGAETGIAITAADTSNGTWHFSTNNGATWNSLGAVANNNARLLAAEPGTRIYFQPSGNFNGPVNNAITFRAWDRASGTNGGFADTAINGGNSPFSSATDTAAITVTPDNDAPTTTGIPNVSVIEGAADVTIDLTNYFDDLEDTPATLSYAVTANDNASLVGTSVVGNNLTLSFLGGTGIANIDVRATDNGDNGDPAKSVTAMLAVHVNPQSPLLLSTVGDVSGAATNGLQDWDDGQAIGFGDPNLDLGSSTDGTFSSFFSLSQLGVSNDMDAVHYVTRSLTVGGGGNTYDLEAGDVLFSIKTSNPTTTVAIGDETAHDRDVLVFRPTVAGDYTAGTFDMLLDDLPKVGGGDADEVHAISLVEVDTTVGDTTLNAGDFLYATKNSDNDILLYSPTGVGAGTTSGTPTLLIDGSKIGISPQIDGLHLVTTNETMGGVSLSAGQILVSIADSDSVGTNNLSVSDEDVFILTVTGTELPPAPDSQATASMFFNGSHVELGGGSARDVDALSLTNNGVANLAPSTSGLPDVDVNEGAGNTVIDLTAYFSDSEDSSSDLFYYVSGNTDSSLFTSVVVDNAADTLTLDYAPDAFGSSDISITARDSGLLEVESTFSVTIDPKADTPSITPTTTDEDNQSTSGLVISRNAADGAEVTHFKITNITGGTLYKNDGVTQINNGNFITFAEGSAGLKFTPTGNYSGPASFDVQASATGNNSDLSSPVAASITVNPVNDDPTITSDGGAATASVNVAENTTSVTTVSATDVDIPAQTLAYSISGGADQGKFNIDSVTGALTFAFAQDFETPADSDSDNVYEVEVTVSDGIDDDMQSISVTVTDVTEVPLSKTEEFLVNSETGDDQQVSGESRGSTQAVALAPTGDYVVVWTSYDQDEANTYGVYAQRFDATGTAQGPEFRVNETTADDQRWGTVATDSSGNFVVAWTSDGQDGSGRGIYARLYNAAGVPQTGEFLVNSTTSGTQDSPSVAMSGDGEFVVVWEGNGSGDSSGVFAQRYNAAGVAQGGELLVNGDTSGTQSEAAVAMDSAGNFVVVWDDSNGFHGRRFSAAGVALGPQFTIDDSSSAGDGDVAMDVDGDFVAVWRETLSGRAVLGQRYSASGMPQGSKFVVNMTFLNDQTNPSVDMDQDGNFVVVWEGNGLGDDSGVFWRQYNAAGVPQTDELRVNQTLGGTQHMASVGMNGLDNFVVVRTGAGPGDSSGVFARQYDGTNNAPTVTSSAAPNVPEGTTAVVTVTTSDVDGDASTFEITGGADQAFFTIDAWTGELTFNAAPDFESPGDVDGNNVYEVEVTANDGSGAAVPQTINVMVTNVNEAPTITDLAADNLAYSTGSGPQVIEQGDDALVADVDSANFAGGRLRVSIVAGGTPLEDVLSIFNQGSNSGEVGYLAGNATYEGTSIGGVTGGALGTDLFVNLNANATPAAVTALIRQITYENIDLLSPTGGPRTIRFTIDDGDGATSLAHDAFVNVNSTNNPPTVSPATFNIDENSGNGTSVGTVVASDPDAGQSLSYSIIGGSGATAFAIDGSSGEITVADTAQLDFETTSSFTIDVQVTDNGGPNLSDTATITIHLNPLNDNLPVAAGETVTVAEGATATMLDGGAASVLANDADADLPGDTLSAVLDSGPSFAAGFVLHADGTFSYTHDGSENFSDSFSYHVFDGANNSTTIVVSITVTPANDNPSAAGDAYEVEKDGTLNVAAGTGLLANDSDSEGDPLTVSLVSDVSNGALTLHADGSFTYKPNANFQGTDSFTYQVADGNGGVDVATVTITVKVAAGAVIVPPTSDPPPATDPPPANDAEEETAPLTITLPAVEASDPGASGHARSGSGVLAIAARRGPGASGFSVAQELESGEFFAFQSSIKPNRALREVLSPETMEVLERFVVPFDIGLLANDLQELAKELSEDTNLAQVMAGSAVGISGALTVGYVLWTIRGGWLLTSLLAQMPAWRMVDPLVVLNYLDEESEASSDHEEDASLEQMIEKSNHEQA